MGIITCKDFNTELVRLGNKLFFYSSLIGLSHEYNRELMLPDYFLWKYLKNKPNIGNKIGEIEFKSNDDVFNKNICDDFFNKNINTDVNVLPYCQTELSFINCKDKVYEALQFKDEYINDVKLKYENHLTKPTIGISVRLGHDMRNNGSFYKIPLDWYINTLEKYFPDYKDNYNVVIFSDNINEAKKIFSIYNFYYAEHNDTHIFRFGVDNSENGVEHLILGGMMNHFIISQSTFSWWQAWLCKNNPNNHNSKIIHTGKNFDGHFLHHFKNKNYYSDEWILESPDSVKLNNNKQLITNL